MIPRRRPEVLAPVGSPDCLPAAVAGGADAVFLGLRHFNARGRAENFRKAELAHHGKSGNGSNPSTHQRFLKGKFPL